MMQGQEKPQLNIINTLGFHLTGQIFQVRSGRKEPPVHKKIMLQLSKMFCLWRQNICDNWSIFFL